MNKILHHTQNSTFKYFQVKKIEVLVQKIPQLSFMVKRYTFFCFVSVDMESKMRLKK